MREICIDDNSNDERQEALARFEQLRKTKMVVDDNVESIISRRTDSY